MNDLYKPGDGNGVTALKESSSFLMSIKDDLADLHEKHLEGLKELKTRLDGKRAELENTRINYYNVVGEDLAACDDYLQKAILGCVYCARETGEAHILQGIFLAAVIVSINMAVADHAVELNQIDEE